MSAVLPTTVLHPHFTHRGGDAVGTPSVPSQGSSQHHKKKHHHNIDTGNERPQLHKRRKTYEQQNHTHHIPPPHQTSLQPHANSFHGQHEHPENQFQPPQVGTFAPNGLISFGSLGSSANGFSAPNLALGNPQILNDNLFSTFPQPLVQHSISPLGVDIGSLSNLTQLATPTFVNEPSFCGGAAAGSSFNSRQTILEQLKAQELAQQQLLKPYSVKKTDSMEGLILTGMHSPVSSGLQSGERRHTHHDILRQHNEEYKMKQMKKAAVHQASTRYGHYAPQESTNFNFIIPCLPTSFIEESETTPQKEEVSK